MTQTIFLSTVSNEFGVLRRRLANLAQRTKKCMVRHQDDFFHRGVKTLQKLVEEVQQSSLIVHVIGAQSGWCIPADQAMAFLTQNLDFEKRFPDVALQGRHGNLPATQWEAWLGLFFGKRLLSFQLHTTDMDDLQKSHVDRLNQIEEHPDTVDNHEAIYDEIIGSCITLNVFTKQDIRKPINLPFPTLGSLFKGRDDFLEELRKRLIHSESGNVAITTRPQALFGAGGIGKTRTAIEYAWRNADNYTALLFLSAASPAALTTSLSNLVGVLGIDALESATDDTRLQTVIDWLRSHPGWLAILDNVDDEETAKAVKERLTGLTGGHVLITSRLSAWSGAVDKLELDLLTPEAAADYLLQAADQRTYRDDDVVQAETLARRIGFLSLGLEHAAAYLNTGGRSFFEYLQDWERDEVSILGEFDLNQIDYPRELLVTWRLSVVRLEPNARQLLEILSWIAPDPIPESTIEMVESSPVVGVRGALNALVKYSLVKRQVKDGVRYYAQHQLVQATTRCYQRKPLAVDSEMELTQLVAALAWMDRAYQGDTQDVRNWSTLDPLVPHVLTICEFAHREPKIASGQAISRLFDGVGALFFEKARHREAEPLMRRALAIEEKSHGVQHPSVAIRLNNLAVLLQATNRRAEAESILARVVTILELAYGGQHSDVAKALNNLAQLLQDTNRFEEAESLMRRALTIHEHCCGAEHPDVARDLSNLAALLMATNRMEEAEPLLRRALMIDEQCYGAEHPYVARDLNNLAQVLKTTNRLADAEPLIRRTLAINEQSYGEEHPTVASSLNNLGALLMATNRLEEAEPLLCRALTIDEKSYGAEHPEVARSLNNVAALLMATNRQVEAEAMLRRALEIDEKAYGNVHSTVANCLNNLAQSLMASHRFVEAEPLIRRALSINEQTFNEKHPNVVSNMVSLALLLQVTNRKAEAEFLLRRVLAIDEQAYGADHPYVARDLNSLAVLLWVTNRLSEAEPLMRRALEIDEKFYGAESPLIGIHVNNLALLLQTTNRLEEAEPLMRRALAIDEQSNGVEHLDVARQLKNLAVLLKDLNRSSEAVPLIDRSVKIYRQFQVENGVEHPDWSDVRDCERTIRVAAGIPDQIIDESH